MFDLQLASLQRQMVTKLEDQFKDKFEFNPWESDLGAGVTSVVMGSKLEKAGVNTSSIKAKSLPKAATDKRPQLVNKPFTASGLSVIIHPFNPHIPTAHMNIRRIACPDEGVVWYGGGYDLTPYLAYSEDCIYWHHQTQRYLDKFSTKLYPLWKNNCDRYFYLPHRQEPRGIGGVFFDDFLYEDSEEKTQELVLGLAEKFIETYSSIVQKRKDIAFSKEQKEFQLMRRGRYVEFNLLHDRGTLFGLQSKGRVESILISLPKTVSWEYEPEGKYSHFINDLKGVWSLAMKMGSENNEKRVNKVLTISPGDVK